MELKTNGDGTVTISDNPTLEEVGQAFNALAQVYAQLTKARGPDGQPMLAWPGTKFMTSRPAGDPPRVLLINESPLFGWTGVAIPITDLFRVIGDLATQAADATEIADAASVPDASKH